jgi:hypothetical protein
MPKTNYTEQQKAELVANLISKYGNTVTKEQILEYCIINKFPNPHFLLSNKKIKTGKIYDLNSFNSEISVEENMLPAMAAQVLPLNNSKMNIQIENTIPEKDSTYVPFGFYRQLEKIIKSRTFYPVFITGLSGNGKTTMVEQVAAKLQRECIRVNISIETDEEDLIGGNTLYNGNVVYREGPVIMAMRRGAILLIDEIDRGSNKLMCMQSILEGKPLFNKKTGEIIHPTPGFTVVATANTKGRGTEDGRFIAAQILDEAFLERFPITVEQEYPTGVVEKKILNNKMKFYNKVDEEFAEKLITWADIIRKTFLEGGVDEIISTRRLVNIVQAYSIFDNQEEAIKYCINRFDDDTKSAFIELYEKMNTPEEVLAQPQETNQNMNQDIPF